MVKFETEPLHESPFPKKTGVTVILAVWMDAVPLIAVKPPIVFVPLIAKPIEGKLFVQV